MIVKRLKKIEPEEKEFGIVQDLYHSGLKRTYKKTVGNIRRNTARKISGSIVKDIKFAKDARNNFDTNPLRSGYLREGLEKEANKVSAHVSNLASNEDRTAEFIRRNSLNKKFISQLIDLNPQEKIRMLQKSVAKNGKPNYYIFLGNAGEDSLSHEIGHIKNGQSLNPISRVISHYANETGLRNKYNFRRLSSLQNNGESGLLNSAKRYIGGRVILGEEKRATNRGIKLLKKLGATDKELKESKDNLTLGYNTYRGVLGADWKTTLRNTIQIPSRKESPITYDLVPKSKTKKLIGTYRIPRVVKINKVD